MHAPPSWPHAPPHWLAGKGTYFVTAGTYLKQHYFRTAKRLRFLNQLLFAKADQFGWSLEAWALFSNHYHLVARSPSQAADASSLQLMLAELHGASSHWVNSQDSVTGRKVWHNYRETQLTYQRSYLARLHYVHQNPVKHGLVVTANQYRWCSAAWFERVATQAQQKTIYGMKIDRLNVEDDFEPFAGP
jgi:putative transposase